MKINVTFTGELRCVKSKEYSTKEGKKGKTYQVGIETGEELGMIKCTQEVADKFDRGLITKGDNCQFYADYDSAYDTFRVFDVCIA